MPVLYIFDLGNVVVDIDFNRALGVWSDYSRIPLANLQSKFCFNEAFHQHERGAISDQDFARRLCQDLDMALSYEQFAAGWQAIFVGERQETLRIMQTLRQQGHRVVILSNTNQLHFEYWPEAYPKVVESADKIYLSHQMGMRKPEGEIYARVLQEEGFDAASTLFFDDNEANVDGALQQGIRAIMVNDKQTVPDWFAKNG